MKVVISTVEFIKKDIVNKTKQKFSFGDFIREKFNI